MQLQLKDALILGGIGALAFYLALSFYRWAIYHSLEGVPFGRTSESTMLTHDPSFSRLTIASTLMFLAVFLSLLLAYAWMRKNQQ